MELHSWFLAESPGKENEQITTIIAWFFHMNTVKVSIIVPIFNVEQYLTRCLDSVAEQSYNNIEVIMVDDGSTDNSANIAQGYVEKYPYFRLIKQSNLGLGGARNTGIKYATGDYIAMPDSDDWLHKDYIKILVGEALKHEADVVECNGIQIWENGVTKKRFNHIYNNKIIADSEREEYLKKCSYVVWNKLFKKSIINERQFHEHMTKQDYAWTPFILAKARVVLQINNVLYFYFWRDNSATNLKRVNFDLLKAQTILESDEVFRRKYHNVLQYYYVRNILGTLLWSLSLSYSNKRMISTLIKSAKIRYPKLSEDLSPLGTFKSIWGKMILNDYFFLAYIYSGIYQRMIDFGRNGLNLFRNIIRRTNKN